MLYRATAKFLCLLSFVIVVTGSLLAQMPNAYGPSVTLEAAKNVAVPALEEAVKNHWTIAVAVVDPSGNLVYYEKMDNTQLGSANIAIDKARTAARFKRPTKEFQDPLAAGGRRYSHSGTGRRDSGRRRIPARRRWEDRGCNRRLGCKQRTGCAVREGGSGLAEVRQGLGSPRRHRVHGEELESWEDRASRPLLRFVFSAP